MISSRTSLHHLWRHSLKEAAETAGYVFEPPWKLVEEGEFYGETLNVVPFDGSYKQAVYFGYVNPNTGRGTYDGAPATDPFFKTPVQTLSTCAFYNAEWDYYREVEFYATPDFDVTMVEVQFCSDAAGTEVSKVELWKQDCTNPSVDSWLAAGPFSEQVPVTATHARLLFSFDPVDNYNNDYFGWLVDDIHIWCSDAPKKLSWDEDTPDNLPQGQEGEKYEPEAGYDLGQWVTGDGEVRFSLARECDDTAGPASCEECSCVPLELPPAGRDDNPLPERMTLSTDGFLHGTINAGQAGNYMFWVMVEKGSGRDYQCICRQFTLAVRSDSTGACFTEDFEATIDWTKCGDTIYGPLPSDVELWKVTQSPHYTCFVPDLTGYTHVAAFTTDNTGPSAGTLCTYDTGKRVKGCFCSPAITECYEQGEISVGFKSWRDVEYYTGAAYDKTWVEVSNNGGTTWHKVPALSWDSTDPSDNVWKWQEAGTGLMTDGNDTIKVRFCFDSVDAYGNDHHGWFIDEVTVRVIAGMPVCTIDCPLPDGFVNEPYDHILTYEGGVVDRVEVTGLPEGLEVKSHSSVTTWHVEGTPRITGTFSLTVELQQADGPGFVTVMECPCEITIQEQRCFFFEDFEEDPGWLWGALWGRRDVLEIPDYSNVAEVGVEEIAIGVGNHVAYYGKPTPDLNYDTDDRTTGVLSLVALPNGIDIPSGVEYIELSFDSFREVEQFDKGYDQTKVQIRWEIDGDIVPQWITVWYRDSSDVNSTDWTREFANDTCADKAFRVPELATKMWVRFAFDSVDKWYNGYFGWMVDNITVCWADTGCPIDANISSKSLLPRGGNELSVMNVPNPVRDVHTTTFTVRGLGIEAIKIQIFDLNETLVFEQETPGNEMVWHTDNDYGEYLANGIYFYRAYAKMGDMWVQTKFQKLVILR